MFRAASILALVVSLVVCPLRCMGATPGDAAQTEAKSGCSCCGCGGQIAEDAPLSGEAPPAESPQGACDDCLCRGAIRGDDRLDLSDGERLPCVETLVLLSEFTTSAAPGEGAAVAPAPDGPSGWSIRLRMQSLLI